MPMPARVWPVSGVLLLAATVWSCGAHTPAAPPPQPPPAPAPGRAGTDLAARQASTDVSEEVMSVLLRSATSLPGDTVERGPAPDDFPKDLFPPGTEPGTAAISERMTTVVGIAPALSAAGRLKEPSRLAAAGWHSTVPTPRGFSAPSSVLDRPASVCRGTDFVTIAYVDRAAGGSFVRASLTKDPRRACVARPEIGFPDVVIPSLVSPVGVRSYGGGGGGGADDLYSRTRLDTTQPARTIAAHYVKQMEEAGWKVDGRANDGDLVSVTRMSIVSSIGDHITASLTVTALEGTTYLDLTLHIVRNVMPGRGGRGM